MFDPFKKLKLASAFLGVDSPPAAVTESLDITELFGLSLKDLRGMTLPAEKLLEQPGVRALHESRYMPAPEPLDRLTELGDGTLGFEVARYLRQHKLPQPQLVPNLDLNDPAVYLSQRVRMTHPILHVVTEYDNSSLGELALQAYYVGQMDNLISGVIISSVLLKITRDSPELLGPALEVTAEAYQRGKAARSFLGFAWEELWSAQVPQLRELIEVPPRSSAVAQLRSEPAAPVRAPVQSTSSSSRSAFGEDGFAAFGRSSSSSSSSAASSSSSSSSSSSRGFAGFGSSPSPPAPEPSRPPSRPVAPPSPPSKLLASFMALAEQEAAQPTPPPAPEPPPRPPPRVETRAPSKPPPPPPAPPKPAPPEPTYQVEDASPKITPALTPDDPDYF